MYAIRYKFSTKLDLFMRSIYGRVERKKYVSAFYKICAHCTNARREEMEENMIKNRTRPFLKRDTEALVESIYFFPSQDHFQRQYR